MVILLIISFSLNLLFLYMLYNAVRKIETLEKYASMFLTDLTNLRTKITEANQVINQADTLGAFESDDEVGTAFQIIKGCLNQLESDALSNENYGKD